MATMKTPDRKPDLEEVEIHKVLSNERRQLTLKILGEAGGEMSARELSERIAEIETGESPPPRNIRQSAYVSLLQTHLPKLDELDVVEYDDGAKTVDLSHRAKQVTYFMGIDKPEITEEIYLLLSLIGVLFVAASIVGGPLLNLGHARNLAGVVFLVMFVLAAYRAATGDSSLLKRVRR